MYAGERAFLAGALPFIREGVAAGEPVLVVVGADKIELLRAHLDGEGERVRFADMAAVGANPARIIPAWHDFVREHAAPGRPVRGIGEPITADRSAAALTECHRHEALLNLAFARADGFRLLCPYDTEALDAGVLAEARRTHPFVLEHGAPRASARYAGIAAAAAPFDDPLPEPPAQRDTLRFDADALPAVRALVLARAAAAGLDDARARDLVLGVHEIASNSVRHGGGQGALDVWADGDALICQVRDEGLIDRPLAGRERPAAGQFGGYGLWLANHLCDLVQVRSGAAGTVVRLHMAIA
jgi:anti-sigma regulatory factor (Ser/Thr protein kinase)